MTFSLGHSVSREKNRNTWFLEAERKRRFRLNSAQRISWCSKAAWQSSLDQRRPELA